ncbi:hypothetical protein Pcinc_000832 [Petrolisthes cinctipes]|uniref:THAP-type domain-containing protein n=1 Tax=Petrolisthes cinctipes TaxID=88211 RepID=A0AAE1L432_PETCI|nr:hypothetical protein Pcinc_000832 [Petrolisthes cinctipes]
MYHAICSRHFIDWCQGPSPSHPDPELFAYNNWEKRQYIRRSIYKRQRVENRLASSCPAASEKTEVITNSSRETSSQLQAEEQQDHSLVANPVMYHTNNQDIQATVEISSSNADMDSPVLVSKYWQLL